MSDAGFTASVRQELARQPVGTDAEVQAELALLLRLAGSLTLHGGAVDDPDRLGLALTTTSGAVARRAYTLLVHRYDLRAELLVRAPAGVQRRSQYRLRLAAGSSVVARDLAVVDRDGRPVEGLPAHLVPPACTPAGVRGALLAAASLSAPGRPPHLELAVRSHRTAEDTAALLRRVVTSRVSVVAGDRWRVVCKSGAAIGELLAAAGATTAFLTWDDRRLRRQLRADANRLANADAANLQRTIEAAGAQTAAVEAAIAAVGWETLDDELRAVALARLANPAASLTELGGLLDPPVVKSVVHRRLRRLQALAEGDRDVTDRP